MPTYMTLVPDEWINNAVLGASFTRAQCEDCPAIGWTIASRPAFVRILCEDCYAPRATNGGC